jgi:hypothetical protein
MRTARALRLSLAAVVMLPAAAAAQGNRVPQRGDHASVIERLKALETAVALLETDQQSLRNQATSLEGGVASLESDVQAIENRPVMALNPYLGVTQDQRGPLVRLTGVNLQIVNGTGATDEVSLGNLIVGYDETAPEGSAPPCWNPTNPPPFGQPCVAYKLGWHNIVAGSYNGYADHGGLVAGTHNTVKDGASITAGAFNRASSYWASISGGEYNGAGPSSSVSGGAENQADEGGSISGGHSNSVHDAGIVNGGEFNRAHDSACQSVSGGFNNLVGGQSGSCGSVSGGAFNLAGGSYSSISGGERNRAIGPENDGYADYATITGGDHNVAWTLYSSISGGSANATGIRNEAYTMTGVAITGGYHNNSTAGNDSSISGGKDRTATGDYNWVAGSLLEFY